ncbi:DUF2975 domain-containing protein [Novosphingobium sp. Gsoil 351]|uniref:DUF2975 domain-containing protein n=1 Tax=Novosphingobium sp. Gsoil 351 TaxID=2675225 RepID=UPI0012B4B0ED|nr:DUF2975 domain-containing protein [Novosphingobium sp. Gsoil 351]QGN54743.1 DUF2975 domain-containing protein [Novosphingobium sp. Gsoil 351]
MTPKRDPLLTAARLLLMVFIGVLGVAAVAALLVIPVVIVFQARVLAEIAAKGVETGPEMIGAILIVLAGIAVLLAMAVWFLVLLRRIVLSVGTGDPFIPENAERLSRMGWLVLAGQIASIPVGALVLWIASVVEDSPAAEHAHADLHSDFGFSFSSLLLMLVLFILARVFRRGAAMREELEGTV